MASRKQPVKCSQCSVIRPGRDWDDHDTCPACRSCTRQKPCERCIGFTPQQWEEIETWLTGRNKTPQAQSDSANQSESHLSPPLESASGTGSSIQTPGAGQSPSAAGTKAPSNAPKKGTRTAKKKLPKKDKASKHKSSQGSKDAPRSSPQAPRTEQSKRMSPVSDISSEDSDAGHRRGRPVERTGSPHHSRSPLSSDRRAQERREDREWLLAQITSTLGPLLQNQTLPNVEHPSPQQPDPDVLDCMASEGFPEEDPFDDTQGSSLDPPQSPSEDEDEIEDLPKGAGLTAEAVSKAIQIFKKHLGFKDPTPVKPSSRVSTLTSTNLDSVQAPRMPVDAVCYELFDAVAKKKRWTAFPASQEQAIKLEDEAWGKLFRPPKMPQEAKEKARADQGATSGLFRDPVRRRLEDVMFEIDQASRASMKFASVILLVAEILMRAHQQLPRDPTQVSRRETGQLLLLLGPLARLLFSQSARVAVKTMKCRRQNVLATMKWPSPDTKNSLLELPFEGSDLFAGCFQSKLEEEVRRHEAVVKSAFRRPRGPSSARPARQHSKGVPLHTRAKPFSHPRSQNRDRGRLRGTSRPAYPYRAWAQSRRDRNTTRPYPPRERDIGNQLPRSTFEARP